MNYFIDIQDLIEQLLPEYKITHAFGGYDYQELLKRSLRKDAIAIWQNINLSTQNENNSFNSKHVTVAIFLFDNPNDSFNKIAELSAYGLASFKNDSCYFESISDSAFTLVEDVPAVSFTLTIRLK